MSKQFYFKSSTERLTYGPFTPDELRQQVKSGSLKPEDSVWEHGGSKVFLAKDIKGLFSNNPPIDVNPISESAINTPPNARDIAPPFVSTDIVGDSDTTIDPTSSFADIEKKVFQDHRETITRKVGEFKSFPKLKQYCILNHFIVIVFCVVSFLVSPEDSIDIVSLLAGLLIAQSLYHAVSSFFSFGSDSTDQAKRHFQYMLITLPNAGYLTARVLVLAGTGGSTSFLRKTGYMMDVSLMIWAMLGVMIVSLFLGIVYRENFHS